MWQHFNRLTLASILLAFNRAAVCDVICINAVVPLSVKTMYGPFVWQWEEVSLIVTNRTLLVIELYNTNYQYVLHTSNYGST